MSAVTNATFVTVGGQHVEQLTATTRYEQSRLEMDVNARQAQRSMSAAGTVLLNPDDRELRLTRLELAEQNLQWHLAPGSVATVRYGSGVTTVKDLRLASGDQEIAADGTFGKSGEDVEPLNITVKNLDLSAVDALLLRPPQFSGRLNASGTVSGSVDAPQAKGEFAVNEGGFRGFRYEGFKGTAAYDGTGVTIDTQLQQNQAASLRATGFVPATAFKAPEEPAAEASGKAAEFDLRIESTPIDLGIVQGFTTALTNVTGTAQANIHVTGSGTDPRPSGEIRFAGGAFTVDATGVPYTGLNGRIELQDDRVHIASLGVSDNARSTLSLTGDVPIRRALTGDVTLQITAHDFKVLDNKMGKVRINSDLQVAGELRAPRIEGELGLSTGTINLDPLLASAGDGAYATKPVEYLPASRPAPDQDAAGAEETPGFAGVAMNVHVIVPDDFVIKSSDLRTGSAPIGLGAVNLTLGGDLRATKARNQSVRLTGSVNTVRGTYQFQSRQFTILRDGSVRFDADPIDRLNPELDIRTQRIIQGVQANADIRGTLQRPADSADQRAPTRTRRHPRADRLQPAGQPARRRAAVVAQRAGRAARARIDCWGAVEVARQPAEGQRVSDSGGAGNRRRGAADRGATGEPEPLRQAGAGHGRREHDERRDRVRVEQLAAPAGQLDPGGGRAAGAVSGGARQRLRSDLHVHAVGTRRLNSQRRPRTLQLLHAA